MSPTKHIGLSIDNIEAYMALFGANDQNIALLELELDVSVALRGTELNISGTEENVLIASDVIEKLLDLIKKNEPVDKIKIRYAISLAKEGKLDELDEIMRDVVAVTHRGKRIKAKTLGQRAYVQNVKNNVLTFAVGPAGTGKTYLAMAMAVVALRNKEVERIILTRPAVEAGEKLGFLPGDLAQKVDPYLRPLYDALYDLMGTDAYQKLSERGAIEVAPLAYMRGRTLSDSFVILDEAQNTTPEQMKMFLTRLGFQSRVIVTGDITQIDLPFGKRSGLIEALEVLKEVPGIGISRLTHKDVVRHELVQLIVQAYDAYQHKGTGREKEADA